jgi:hypothetical protein
VWFSNRRARLRKQLTGQQLSSMGLQSSAFSAASNPPQFGTLTASAPMNPAMTNTSTAMAPSPDQVSASAAAAAAAAAAFQSHTCK